MHIFASTFFKILNGVHTSINKYNHKPTSLNEFILFLLIYAFMKRLKTEYTNASSSSVQTLFI